MNTEKFKYEMKKEGWNENYTNVIEVIPKNSCSYIVTYLEQRLTKAPDGNSKILAGKKLVDLSGVALK